MKTCTPTTPNRSGRRNPAGFVLLLAMIVLVVLASLAASLSVQLTMAKRRQQFMIEYQRARYGLDSAIKYILSEMPNRTFKVEARPDVPDFSDLFWMNEEAYGQYVLWWASTATDEQLEAVMKKGAMQEKQTKADEGLLSWLNSIFSGSTEFDPNTIPEPNVADEWVELDPNDIEVPGPYGVPWPYVTVPMEFTIGTSKVTITIEDENAKMPLSWMVTNFQQVNKQAQYSLETFAEWMQMSGNDVKELKASMEAIYKQKMFTVNPSPIMLTQTTASASTASSASAGTAGRRTYTRTQPGARTDAAPAAQPAAVATTAQRPATAHTTDFAKLFHSSLLNHEVLARPLPDTGQRTENAMKYLSLWGAQRININTAPRHVLEAAFMLAGDGFTAPELAQKVIDQRKEKPFEKIDELKEAGMMDTESFNQLKNYISTASTFFKIRVTSQSGNASTSAVATVIKEGKNMETLAILYGY